MTASDRRAQDASAKNAGLQGVRCCLVDDHAATLSVLEQYAETWGLRAVSAPDGPRALEVMRQAAAAGYPIELALLDMQMPGMTGLELARMVKADPVLASMRLVMLTALGERGDAKLAQEAGLAGYLTKPIRQEQLFNCLRLVMSQAPRVQGAGSGPPPALVTKHQLSEAQAAKKGRLLVAEDNPINQKIAAKMLEKLGYKVDVVSNGSEAVDAVFRQPYMMVLMDCQMPEMDGFEATRTIRAWEREGRSPKVASSDGRRPDRPGVSGRQRIPIVAMTANAMSEDRRKCLDAGMDDFVSKPVSATVLSEVLARWFHDEGHERAA